MTKGEYRVGISFNPSGASIVDEIKSKAAVLIDLIELIPSPEYGGDEDIDRRHCIEVGRLKALAQTDIEIAAMHAVKAATKRAPT